MMIDSHFMPAFEFNKTYQKQVGKSNMTNEFSIAIENPNGNIIRKDVSILDIKLKETKLYINRMAKFMLWAFGGTKLYLSENIEGIPDSFTHDIMLKVFGTFEVVITEPENIPTSFESSFSIGGNLNGNRIGFDLGASDYKLSAVSDGNVLFSDEIPWNPVDAKSIEYHREKLQTGLEIAASHLPCVEGIGGSSAGIIVDNKIKVASLFRSVKEDFTDFFEYFEDNWKVPFNVINDGDVTALAGSMSLKKNSILGMAMGSSEACGYVNDKGKIVGHLNELAFAPVDYNTQSVRDEWSKDFGVGALYFSQQAVNKLASFKNYDFKGVSELPERLKIVQQCAYNGELWAQDIFKTIGHYLGHTIPHYLDFYNFENILLLGRVTSGTGGELILQLAKENLRKSYPEIFERIEIVVPDEKSRRVGQAVAAASLPII